MTNTFSNIIKHKSALGQLKYSNASKEYFFKGITSGLALKYVAKGEEIYYINKRIVSVPEGHFILVRPNTHFETHIKNQSSVAKGVCIDLSLISPQIDIKKILDNTLLFNHAFNLINSTLIGHQLNQMGTSMEAITFDQLQYECLIKTSNYLHTFSENIFHFKKEIHTIAKKETTQEYIIPKLLQTKEYIVKNYKNRIVLDELAQYIGISKFQLLRLFKQCFNCSPQEMQTALRMEKAKNLLQTSYDSISKIAFDLGYFDLAAFSKKFKTHFGVPPSYFKNKQYFTK
ncbi:AraC family transcriptional regulator [uncultured Aquimarina sp.]|uniref:helix-turn-helix domain-containing protein n=1 Tax=uncultured Aquimarina sp. TaxID=575652 RepID=UPI002617CA21|nr:AraC family transcriptional regulator [uncultured Aquimarina sp.]